MRPNPHSPADLVTFNEKILNGKFHFLCSDIFQDCLSHLCFYVNDHETSTHDLLHFPTNKNERMTLLDKGKSINCGIAELSDGAVTKILLFGDNILSAFSNTLISNSTTDYVISTRRFDDSILTHG